MGCTFTVRPHAGPVSTPSPTSPVYSLTPPLRNTFTLPVGPSSCASAVPATPSPSTSAIARSPPRFIQASLSQVVCTQPAHPFLGALPQPKGPAERSPELLFRKGNVIPQVGLPWSDH